MDAGHRCHLDRLLRRCRFLRETVSVVAAAILCVCVLGGCVSEVPEVSPPVSMPQEFSSGGEGQLVDEWWRAFNDASLNRLVDHALGNSFELKIAWDRLAQAEAIARRTGAALKPQVDLSASARRTRERKNDNTDYTNKYLLGLPASYEVDLWGRLASQQQAALLDAQASREDVAAAAISLTARIAQTWYQLAEAQQQISVITAQIETNKEVLDGIDRRTGMGQTGLADLLRQKQFVISGYGQLILARERVDSLKNQLAVLVGLPPNSQSLDMDGELVDLPAMPLLPLPAELIHRRPDVHSAYRDVQAADRRLAAAIAEKFPRISLSANLETSGSRTRDLFDNWLASLAGNLAQPLLDGDRISAEIERNRAVLSEVINAYGQAILTSLREVEDALVQEKRQREYLDNLDEQLKAAKAVRERTEASYVQGQLDYLRMLDSQVSLQSLERSCVTAKRELIELRIDLCRAIAGSWEIDRPEQANLEQ